MAKQVPAEVLPVAAPGVAVGRGDRGRGGRGRGQGRGRYGRGDRGRNPTNARARTAASTSKGNTPDMNGNVFQCHNEAANTS